jgi:hypothetical protein
MGTWDSVDYQAMIADIIDRAIARVRSKTRQAVA